MTFGTIRRRWTLLFTVALAVGGFARGSRGDQVIADFDVGAIAVPVPQNAALTIERDGDGGLTGKDRMLRVVPRPDTPAGQTRAVIFPLGPADAAASAGVAVSMKAPPAPGGGVDTVALRWAGVDENNRIVLQRNIKLPADDAFHEVNLPWPQWRWGVSAGGVPSELRKLALLVDSPVPELQVDDLRLTAAAPEAPPPADWLRKVAFGDRDVRMAEAEGILVATDAVDGLKEADLQRVLGRMRKVRAVIKRLFGEAVRPLDGKASTPAALLIFKDADGYKAFGERLGKEWGVMISPPGGQGYTVQDVAFTTYDPKQGADRPVFFHESVHAVFAHDVRLLTGHDHQSWLHEGLASYLQAAVFPRSLDARVLPPQFAKPIPADGSGFFVPLGMLMTKRVMPKHYVQVATVIAYLAEERPQWLPTIARALADGKRPELALEACGTSVAALEAEWFKWGKTRFAARVTRPPFEPPVEFREAK